MSRTVNTAAAQMGPISRKETRVKVHFPGHSEPQPNRKHQHLEKRYFEPGGYGFRVWRASAASWACASATDVAGRKPIA